MGNVACNSVLAGRYMRGPFVVKKNLWFKYPTYLKTSSSTNGKGGNKLQEL